MEISALDATTVDHAFKKMLTGKCISIRPSAGLVTYLHIVIEVSRNFFQLHRTE